MKLYQIANEFQSMLNFMEENEALNNETQKQLDDITATAEEKIKNVGMMIQTLKHEHAIVEMEYKRLERKRKSYKDQIEWLRSYLAQEMERLHIEKVNAQPFFNINLQEGKYKVMPINEEIIPLDYWTTKTSLELDKTKIMDEMLAGVIIPGTQLVKESYVIIR